MIRQFASKVNQVVLATHNPHKAKEMAMLAADKRWQWRDLRDFDSKPPDEVGATFIENALIKARNAAKVTQLPVMADDSGLIVPVLDGQPGLFSARYAGKGASDRENRCALISALREKELTQATAYFYCVMVFIPHPCDPMPLIGEGRWFGQVMTKEQGQGGFGYDPMFYPQGCRVSAAELSADDKICQSHRGLAWQYLMATWEALVSQHR